MATSEPSGRARAAGAVRVVLVLGSTAVSGWLLVRATAPLLGRSTAPWVLGRASGLTSYALLTLLVCAGLLLSHPAVRRWRRPHQLTRVRLHATLAVFTLAFTTLHVVVLVADPWAHVGWRGALVPLASSYRPVGVTLGVLAVWSALLTGLTTALAGRGLGRVWWPVHKVAGLAFLLVWAHAVLAGSDSRALLVLYLASGGAVLVLALSRYQAATAVDLRDALAADPPPTVSAPERDRV